MPNQIRLMFIASIMGLFLVACGDENAPEQSSSEETAEVVAATPATPANMSVEEGMTEEAATAKFGEPSLSQTRTLDQLVITHKEWTTDAGTLSIQFQNGKATYHQFISAK